MERSRLSIRALVVLASELGAEHLFGVRDPFMMMDHEEIRAAYEVCLEELEQKLGFAARLRTLSVELDQASELVSLMKQENSDQRLERLGGILSDIRRGL